MSDEELAREWSLLAPTASELKRIEDKVTAWLDASEASLAAEWLGLVRRHPLAGFGYAAASACWLVLITPVGWLASSLLS